MFRKFLKRLLIGLVIIGLTVTSVLVYLGYQEYKSVVTDDPIGEVVTRIQERDDYVRLDDIDTLFLDAIVAVEDQRYWTRGSVIDYRSLGRAILTNLINFELREGGSTIPQQISKNLYFEDNLSLIRKIAEVFISRDLLNVYTKEELLELYVNIIYYGNDSYGIYNASLSYFNVVPKELSDGQATLLAGLPQSPSIYDPTEQLDLAKLRQEHVLDRLLALGYITDADYKRIYAMEVFHEKEND